MTAPELLARVRTHLLTQGRRALRGPDSRRCAYRSPDGLLSCAVGCLIADGAYDPAIEGAAVVGLAVRGGAWIARPDRTHPPAAPLADALNASGVPATPVVRELLVRLQSLHDNGAPAEWRPVLDAIAAWLDAGDPR